LSFWFPRAFVLLGDSAFDNLRLAVVELAALFAGAVLGAAAVIMGFVSFNAADDTNAGAIAGVFKGELVLAGLKGGFMAKLPGGADIALDVCTVWVKGPPVAT